MKTANYYITILFLLLHGLSRAGVPEKINYQCVVRNAAGVIVANTPVKIKFSILDGANVVYAEEHLNLTTNQFGLITALIGDGLPLMGQFDTINWAGGSAKLLKLETDINFSGTYTDMGTTQLVTVPYAMVAKKTLDGNAHQTLTSYNFTTTIRNTDVFTNDSLVVAETGTYLIIIDAEGYGITYNSVAVPYGDNAVNLKIFADATYLNYAPLHDYKKDDANFVSYNLTPRQSARITTLPLSAGQIIRPAVRIGSYGTGGVNTNAMGYLQLELTLVKLQ